MDSALAELGQPYTEQTVKQESTAAAQFGTLGSGNHFAKVCLDAPGPGVDRAAFGVAGPREPARHAAHSRRRRL
ncbi:RtcB family protein [Sphaerisporangium album]|uniref:RtcB family protein n=1 Tax=Sphaerisporangium album TaxID=509200 RepID=UPI001FE3E89D|nr:RtcB family protein [Sphaerisporangium album]